MIIAMIFINSYNENIDKYIRKIRKEKYKMRYRNYTKQDVLNKTHEAIHLFYDRDIETLSTMLDENFIWIGSYELQYTYGKEKFLNITKSESKENPVDISQEEYSLLFQEGHLWTIHGRYTATTYDEDGKFLMAKVRVTIVWKQVNDQLLLLHIHGSDARDVPLQYEASIQNNPSDSTGWFEYVRKVDMEDKTTKRIQLKDYYGSIHHLLLSEFLYVKSDDKYCIVHTGTSSFSTRITLKKLKEMNPKLVHIHKSYLVNTSYIKKICRYDATLIDGTIIPIAKERYMQIKNLIKLNTFNL